MVVPGALQGNARVVAGVQMFLSFICTSVSTFSTNNLSAYARFGTSCSVISVC